MRSETLVVGNWKTEATLATLSHLGAIGEEAARHPALDVVICPPATLLGAAASRTPGVRIGGQDCTPASAAPVTGAITPEMLCGVGASMVIVGHSERRRLAGEGDDLIRAKAAAALATGLDVVLCVGETLAQRNAGTAWDAVSSQLAAGLPQGRVGGRIMIAYEPVWAIGSGRPASGEEVARMHHHIRGELIFRMGHVGACVPILYGGSVSGRNAAGLLGIEDVDGVLVGGASLSATDFVPVLQAAGEARH